MNKYKEFYIYESYDGRTDSVSEEPLINVPSQIHVIEYAAVEEAIGVAEKSQYDLLAAKEEIKALRDALEFYADEYNWRENTLNDLSDPLVKRDIKCPNGDMESYGYLEDDGSNRLNIVGGKTARQALKQSKERLGEL